MSGGEDAFARRERARVRAQARVGLFGGSLDPLRIDRFVIQRRLGEGAFGIVYLARDEALERLVAIKVLRRAHDAQAAARMRREARAMASLTHAHVVPIYDVGAVDGRTYLAMRYVEGPTLRAWVEQSRPSVRAILAAFEAAGRGLAAAHAAGLVHRDFKPDNVMLDGDGHVFVGDFGLAQIEDEADLRAADAAPRDASLTATGHVLGTPSYLAPEVIGGSLASAKSDQFAFAVALAEALDGRHPFWGSTPAARMKAITLGKTRPGARRGPRHVRAAIARAMHVDPAARFEDMTAFLDALAPKRRAPYAIAAAVAVLVAVGTWVGPWRGPPPVDVAEVARVEPIRTPDLEATVTHAVEAAARDAGVREAPTADPLALYPSVVPTERDEATVALDRGDYGEAIRLLDARRSAVEREHGARSVEAVESSCAVARAHLEALHHASAVEAAERAVVAAEHSGDAVATAHALALLAVAQLHTRDKDRAPANLARARTLAASERRAEVLADVLRGEGIALRMKKSSRDAVVSFREARALVESRFGPTHRELVPLLTLEGAALLDIGRAKHAVEPLERAARLGALGGERNLPLARAKFFLATALWDAEVDRVRAVSLAEEARAIFTHHGLTHPRVESWLAEAQSSRDRRR